MPRRAPKSGSGGDSPEYTTESPPRPSGKSHARGDPRRDPVEPGEFAAQQGVEPILKVFEEASTAASKMAMRPRARRLWEAHRKAFVQGTDDQFEANFRSAILLTLGSAKQSQSVENMMYFFPLYLKDILVIPEARDYRDECTSFVQDTIMFLAQGLEARQRLVRRRSLKLISDVLTSKQTRQALEFEIVVEMRSVLLDRCRDVDKSTRLLAMTTAREALVGRENVDEQVLELLEMLADSDPSPNGRAKALTLLAGAEETSDEYIQKLLGSTRDPSPTVRATAFRSLINHKITIETLNRLGKARSTLDNELPDFLTNRVLRGINDSSARVKDLATQLIYSWIKEPSGLLGLLESFGVLPEEGAAINRHSMPLPKEDLFKKLLADKSILRQDAKGWISGTSKEQQRLVGQITPEQATYLRIVAQNELNTENEESELPELIELATFIYKFFHVKINRTPEDHELNDSESVYTFGQLLLTASYYDLKDPASREKILHVVDDALRSPWALEWNYPILMKILRKAYPSDAEFITKTKDYLSAISEELDTSTRWDAELTITEGILENIDTLETTEDPEFYNELAAPVIRCFTVEGAATIPYDMVAEAMHIMGLLALAAPHESERLLTIMAQRYSDQDQEAYEKQQEMNEDIERLRERLSAPRLSRTAGIEAREQISELEKTRAIPETWDERRKILQIMSDVMLKHNFFHDSSIQIILHGIMAKDDPELQSICVANATKLVFANVWDPDTYEILNVLIKIYFEQFTYERSPRSHDSYCVVYSVVEILEYFFGIYQLSANNTLNLARQFPNAVFDAMKALIVDIPELQKNKREFNESDDEEIFPEEPPQASEIDNIFNSFQGSLGNFIRWSSTVTLPEVPTEFTTNGIVAKMFLEEILSIQADFAVEDLEYKSVTPKGQGVHGRNDTFYKVWDAYSQVLFDHLKNIELEDKLSLGDLDDIIELIGEVKVSSFLAPQKTIAKRLEANVEKLRLKLTSNEAEEEQEEEQEEPQEPEPEPEGLEEPQPQELENEASTPPLIADLSAEQQPPVIDIFGDIRDQETRVPVVESTPRATPRANRDLFAGLSSPVDTTHADIATVIASQQEQLTPTRQPSSRQADPVDLTTGESDDSVVIVKSRRRKRKSEHQVKQEDVKKPRV